MYMKLMNESLKTILENKKALFRALIVPLLFFVVIDLSFPNVIQNGKFIFLNETEKYLVILLAFITFLINISIAVSVHRILLINDDISPWKSVSTTKRELKFFSKAFLLGIISFLAYLIILFFTTALLKIFLANDSFFVAFFLSLFVAIMIFSRFSMVLPATAIDEKMSLYEALIFTKGYKFLSLYMVAIFPALISFLIMIVYGLIIKFLSGVVWEHFSILYVLLNLFITTLVISCLSVTYKYIKEENYKNKAESDI